MILIRYILFVLLYLVGIGVCAQEVDYTGTTRTEAIGKAKVAWKKLKEEYLRGLKMEIQYHSVADPKNVNKAKVYIGGPNEYNWIARQNRHDASKKDELIQVVNTQYSFLINQLADDDAWRIQELFNSPEQARSSAAFTPGGVLWGTTLLFIGVMLEDAWLENLIDSASFEILSLRSININDDDSEYVEMVFKSDFVSDNGAKRVHGGRVLLMPNLYWAIKRYELDVSSTSNNGGMSNVKSSRSIDYQVIDGLPFPKKYETKYDSKVDEKVYSHLKISYLTTERGDIPKDILFLKYYGFAEPNTPTKRGNRIRIVFIVSGIILIGAGLYLRRQGNKA